MIDSIREQDAHFLPLPIEELELGWKLIGKGAGNGLLSLLSRPALGTSLCLHPSLMEIGYSCQACIIAASRCAREGAVKLQNWASPWIARKVYRRTNYQGHLHPQPPQSGKQREEQKCAKATGFCMTEGVFELMQAVEIDTRARCPCPK